MAACACGDDGSGGGGATTTSGADASSAITATTAASSVSGATTAKASASSVSTGSVKPCPDGTSDEFDDPCTLSRWTLEGEDSFLSYDIDATTPGHMTVVPRQGVWTNNQRAFIAYKEATGNFVAMAHVTASGTTVPADAPLSPFNSAGLIARRPQGMGNGQESWVMYDVGRQQSAVGVEAKSTTDGASNLFLMSGARSGRISLCRVGSTFYLSKNLEDDGTTWTRTHTFDRPDMPVTVQLGVVANAYDNPDLTATFDYVRFGTPQTDADCTADLPPGG